MDSTLLVCVLMGIALGALAGLLGTGGGTFAIPLLVAVLGYDQKVAQGTALVMVVVNVCKGLVGYRLRSGLDLRMAWMLALSGSAAATIASRWSLNMASEDLSRSYGLFLIGLAVMVALTGRQARVKTELAVHVPRVTAMIPGAIGGLSLGLFGVGGAMLVVPMLVMFFGQPQIRAQGLGLALAAPGCAIALFQYGRAGQVDWPVGFALAMGGLLGVAPGVTLAHRMPERLLKALFCLFLLMSAVVMLT